MKSLAEASEARTARGSPRHRINFDLAVGSRILTTVQRVAASSGRSPLRMLCGPSFPDLTGCGWLYAWSKGAGGGSLF